MKLLIIIGAGGAGKEASDIANRIYLKNQQEWEFIGFADDFIKVNSFVNGYKVIGTLNDILDRFDKNDILFHCAIGDNKIRLRIVELLIAKGYKLFTLIDPTSIVSKSCSIGIGSYIGPMSFIGPDVQIGKGCIINVGTSIHHDVFIGDYVQLCPGARMLGSTHINDGSFLGTNSVILPGVRVGSWSTVGASALVTKDIGHSVKVIGVPAKEF